MGVGRPYSRFKSNRKLCIVVQRVRGVKWAGRVKLSAVFTVCLRMPGWGVWRGVWGLTSGSSWGDLMMIVGLLGRGGHGGLIGGVSCGRWCPRGRRVVLRQVGVAVEVEFLVFRGAGWEGMVCWGGWGRLGGRG